MSTITSTSAPVEASASATASTTAGPSQPAASSSKLAKNKRLPATMITSTGTVEQSKKKGSKGKQVTKKQKMRSERGKERAVELSGKLETKVREREDKKAKRQRAKKAWD